MKIAILIALILALSAVLADKADKHSEKANQPKENLGSIRNIEKPFRMAQINLIWNKSVNVSNCANLTNFVILQRN